MIDHRVLSLMKHRFLLWKHSSAVAHLSSHNLEQRVPLQRKGEHPVCTHFIYNVVLIFYQYTLCFQQPIFNLILAGGNHRLQVYQRMQSAPIRWFTLSRSNSWSFLLYPSCMQYKYFAKEKPELTPPLCFFFHLSRCIKSGVARFRKCNYFNVKILLCFLVDTMFLFLQLFTSLFMSFWFCLAPFCIFVQFVITYYI